MRILVFSWRDPKHPLAGGAEQVMQEHMKGWMEEGHEVILFASRFKGSKAKDNIEGVKIIRAGSDYLGVQIMGFWYYLKNRNKVDFIVDQFHGLPFLTPLYAFSKPKLAVIQEPARKVWFLNPLPFPINYIVGAIGYVGEPFVFKFYKKTKFMTGSVSAKKDVSEMGIPLKNITIVPHGVILPPGKMRSSLLKVKKNEIKTITFLGILSKDKGIEEALKCFAILDKKGKFNFWVIGRSETEEYGNKLKELVKNLGIAKKIKFWGFVSQEEKFRLLRKSFVLVNPSVHEGWGLVNIEANAFGTPIVSYKSAGLVDSVKENESGVFVKRNTPLEMANKVLELVNDTKKYKQLEKGTVNWSNEFKWENSKKKSLGLIKIIFDEKEGL